MLGPFYPPYLINLIMRYLSETINYEAQYVLPLFSSYFVYLTYKHFPQHTVLAVVKVIIQFSVRGARILEARSPGRLNFVECVGPQHRTIFM